MGDAQSRDQQIAAAIALAVKRGEKPKSSLKGSSKQMYESMNEKELEELAQTRRKDLPKHKGDNEG